MCIDTVLLNMCGEHGHCCKWTLIVNMCIRQLYKAGRLRRAERDASRSCFTCAFDSEEPTVRLLQLLKRVCSHMWLNFLK